MILSEKNVNTTARKFKQISAFAKEECKLRSPSSCVFRYNPPPLPETTIPLPIIGIYFRTYLSNQNHRDTLEIQGEIKRKIEFEKPKKNTTKLAFMKAQASRASFRFWIRRHIWWHVHSLCNAVKQHVVDVPKNTFWWTTDVPMTDGCSCCCCCCAMLSGIIIDAVDPGIFWFDNDDDSAVPEPASGTPPSPEDDSPAMVVVVCSGSMTASLCLVRSKFDIRRLYYGFRWRKWARTWMPMCDRSSKDNKMMVQ